MKRPEQIDRYEEWFTTDLLQDDDGRCIGAICRDLRNGALEVFNAKTMILASGGPGQVYKPTTNGLIVTGDGIAQAYRIGAKLMDMEMVQYHPTTLAGNGLLITEGARGEGAWLLNAEGDRFMEKYAPNKFELASRDVVSRAEQTEINEGRGFPDGTVALDITKVPRRRTARGAARDREHRPRLRRRRHHPRADPHPPGHALHHGRHQDRRRRRDDRAGPVRGRRGGLRLGPRRQPPRARTRCSTRSIFGRRSGEHAAHRALQMPMPSTPASRRGRHREAHRRDHQPPQGGRRIGGDQERAWRDHERVRRGVPRRGGVEQGARDRPPAEGGGHIAADRRPRLGVQPGRDRGDRARVHARRGRDDRGRRAGAQGVPRAPNGASTSRAQRRGVAQAHRHLDERRRRAASELLAGHDHPLAARGKDLLSDARVHAQDPPLRPAVGRGRAMGRAHGRPLAGAVGARRHPEDQATTRTARSGSAAPASRRSAARAACG